MNGINGINGKANLNLSLSSCPPGQTGQTMVKHVKQVNDVNVRERNVFL